MDTRSVVKRPAGLLLASLKCGKSFFPTEQQQLEPKGTMLYCSAMIALVDRNCKSVWPTELVGFVAPLSFMSRPFFCALGFGSWLGVLVLLGSQHNTENITYTSTAAWNAHVC